MEKKICNGGVAALLSHRLQQYGLASIISLTIACSASKSLRLSTSLPKVDLCYMKEG